MQGSNAESIQASAPGGEPSASRTGKFAILIWLLVPPAWLAGPGGQEWLWPFTPFANVLHVLTACALVLGVAAVLEGRRTVAVLMSLPTLALVGWSAPRLSAVEPTGAHAADLTVVSWNLGADVATPDEAAAWIAACDADVIALCELDIDVAERLTADFAERFPYRVLHPWGIDGRGVFSRYPIVEDDFLQLEGERLHLRVTLDVDGRPMRLVVCHLALEAALLGRAEGSVRDLDLLVDELLDGPPGLLVGDFNSSETSALYAGLAERLVDTFRESGSGFGFSFPMPLRYNFVPLPPFVRIDHIWRTAGLESVETWIGPDGGSDHLPVTTRLSFEL
ncbi:MAG: endonuclease/exonuclease/phosphatase family protein [Planctomycetota bacterium]|jgi:endonuclease/exonuclease/phosphatase (EEP) superfamily protein YafD